MSPRVNAANELVCVVDNDQSVRRGLRRLVNSAGHAAEMFTSAEDYLSRKPFEGAICLVLDVRMPGTSGLELQEVLEKRSVGEQIVFITGYNDVPTCRKAMNKGAVDFLLKPFDDAEFLGAVARALDRGRDYLRARSLRRAARAKIDKLTPREFEVLRFVIFGLLNKQIAAELSTAEKTIKVHRGRVMQKLGLRSVPDLVRLSQVAGIRPATSDIRLRSTIRLKSRF